MDRTVIAANVVPSAEDAVAEIFAESDTTELPHLVGVRHRRLRPFITPYLPWPAASTASTDGARDRHRARG